jgi:hypothetical protein
LPIDHNLPVILNDKTAAGCCDYSCKRNQFYRAHDSCGILFISRSRWKRFAHDRHIDDGVLNPQEQPCPAMQFRVTRKLVTLYHVTKLHKGLS